MLFTHTTLFLQDRILENGYLHIHNGKIIDFGPMDQCPVGEGAIDLQGYVMAPGFIDQHTHGAGGADVMDATPEALQTIARTLVREGTTSFLATTMTTSVESITAALQAVAQYCHSGDRREGAQIAGVHLEGPFISSRFPGAQNPQYIRRPDPQLLHQLQQASDNTIRMVTYAIEEDPSFAFLSYMQEHHIASSCGHTSATFAQIEAGVERGLGCLTHFHNAMTSHHHRDPGVVTAGFCLDDLYTEVIADGIHLHPDVIRTIYKIKGSQRMILVTDSMCAKGLPDGTYSLGGQEVIKKGMQCTLASGTLAGSVLPMDQAVRNMARFSRCSLYEAVQMATANPAHHLGLYEAKGGIAPGKDADLVILDPQGQVAQTLVGGCVAYRREE